MFLIFAVACSDYTIHGDPSLYAAPNPPDLGAPVQEDQITQVTVGKVDVLWDIDSSSSMSEEQAALTSNFSNFMNYFLDSGLDYHIGITTTDMDAPSTEEGGTRGRLRVDALTGDKWIDTHTHNPVQEFSDLAHVGINGSGTEKGRTSTYTALETLKNGFNTGFVRDDAYLAMIQISDEDDSSTNPSLPDFIDWAQNYKPTPGMVTYSAIVGPRDLSGCGGGYGGYASADTGTAYLEASEGIGGIEWSICSSNWDEALRQLGMQAAGLKREFFLSQLPVDSTIHVFVDEQDNDSHSWTYDASRNSILFDDFVPDPLSVVHIQYQLLSAWGADTDSSASDSTGS